MPRLRPQRETALVRVAGAMIAAWWARPVGIMGVLEGG